MEIQLHIALLTLWICFIALSAYLVVKCRRLIKVKREYKILGIRCKDKVANLSIDIFTIVVLLLIIIIGITDL